MGLFRVQTTALDVPDWSCGQKLQYSIRGSRNSTAGAGKHILVRTIVKITGFGRAAVKATLWRTTKLCQLFEIVLLSTLWWNRWKTNHLQSNMPMTSDHKKIEDTQYKDTDCYKLYETVYLIILYCVLTALYWTASTFSQVCVVISVTIVLAFKQCVYTQKQIKEYCLQKMKE